ncbi:hypothetical protein P0136_02955 [Lentisphaerota bacterium ZTH]|nr:hypothetical protein JYG24_05905 [Lentisphaerota bacterium]WET06961.1 hypothetical protein P0136_02955 [Lentisphaerota bacterium ZTH]
MRVQEVCDKHNISHKNVLKHCQRGRFILDGIVYTAEDVSKPGARNAKWEITALEGKQPEHAEMNAKEKLMSKKIRLLELQAQRLEQTVLENRIEVLNRFLDCLNTSFLKQIQDVKEFISEYIDEKDYDNWNQVIEKFIIETYTESSEVVFESL